MPGRDNCHARTLPMLCAVHTRTGHTPASWQGLRSQAGNGELPPCHASRSLDGPSVGAPGATPVQHQHPHQPSHMGLAGFRSTHDPHQRTIRGIEPLYRPIWPACPPGMAWCLVCARLKRCTPMPSSLPAGSQSLSRRAGLLQAQVSFATAAMTAKVTTWRSALVS